jgi:hypothetical protein
MHHVVTKVHLYVLGQAAGLLSFKFAKLADRLYTYVTLYTLTPSPSFEAGRKHSAGLSPFVDVFFNLPYFQSLTPDMTQTIPSSS